MNFENAIKNYNLKNIIFLIVTCSLLFACGRQKPVIFKEKITEENLPSLYEKFKNDKSVSREDIDNFANGLSRTGLNRDSLFGKTVEEIIESQKDYNYGVSLAGLKTVLNVPEVAVSHTFQFLKLVEIDTVVESKNLEANVLYFKITNTSKKAISNLNGVINVYFQSQLIKQFPVSVNQTINLGEYAELRSLPYQHDENSPNDRAVRAGKSLSIVWQPYTVQFADGTKISLINN